MDADADHRMPATARLTELDDEALAGWYARAEGRRLRVNFVSSVDGAVAVDGVSAGLSGTDDKRVFRILRMLCDAVLVGAGTLRDEDYRPLVLDQARRAWRMACGLPDLPRLVIVSGTLRLDPRQRALRDAPARPLILTSTDASTAARHPLTEIADVLPVPDLATGLAELAAAGITDVLCEGGPTLFSALLAEDLVDEVCLTLSPLLAGGAGREDRDEDGSRDGSPGRASGHGDGRIVAGSPTLPRHLRPAHVLTAADGTLLLRYART